MILFFLRHGEAGHHYNTDFERELTNDGKHAAANVGKFFTEMNMHFTHAFVSPLVRAQQTAQTVLQKLPPVVLTETKHLTPESDPRNLFELLRSYSNDSGILLVTHEPFVSTCISTLISGTENVNVVMKPTTLACVETTGAPSHGNGRLRWIVTPQIIEHLLKLPKTAS
ncbi:MAG: phosphohistidine phosphatase SixA [Bacteroidota bacterium]